MHACQTRNCTRTFRTEEQLRRHHRQHAAVAKFHCPICSKDFSRSDVLSRHMVHRHGASPPALGRPRKTACNSCSNAADNVDNRGSGLCASCQRARSQSSPHPTMTVTASSMSPHNAQRELDFLTTNMAPAPVDIPILRTETVSASLGSTSAVPLSTYQFQQPDDLSFWFSGPPLFTDTTNMTIAPADASNPGMFDWLDTVGPQQGIFDVLNTHAPNSPNWDFLNTNVDLLAVPALEPVDGHSVDSPFSHPENSAPAGIADAHPHDTPWVHIYRPRTPGAQVQLPAPPSSTVALFDPLGQPLSQSTRERMLKLVEHSHRGVWPSVDVTNFPSSQSLTLCVNLYQRHFHDWLPLLDKASFRFSEASPSLLLAMAAIGSEYSRGDVKHLGVALNELVRRGILFIREHDRRFMFEINIIQASLLQHYFGLYCGSRASFQQAEQSAGSLLAAGKRMRLLRTKTDGPRSDTDAHNLGIDNGEDAMRKRLSWGLFLFDAQLICVLNLPAQIPLSEVVEPLPCSGSETRGKAFVHVLEDLLVFGVFPNNVDDLGYSVIAHALYRLCADAAAIQSVFSQSPTGYRYNLAFMPHVQHNPQILLDRLAAQSLHSASSPTPLLMSCVALAYHAHLRYTKAGFLNLVQEAAGRSGTTEGTRCARTELTSWITSNPKSARNIFAHAAMLSALLGRFMYDVPPEAVWTFHSALSLWAIVSFSASPFGAGLGSPVHISWANSYQIEDWIVHGGPVSIQGVGNGDQLCGASILATFIQRLDGLSWGLARQYSDILRNAAAEGERWQVGSDG